MIDYTRGTGNSATMLIRDWGNGLASGPVVFFINSNNSTTWTDHLPWSGVVNGVNLGSHTFNYQPGAGWQQLGSWDVAYSQDVTFSIGATGTSGFGGPTSFTVRVNRATVPPAPSSVRFSSITSTSVVTAFDGQGDGGSPITDWNLGYGTDSNTPQTIVSSGGTLLVSGLTPGTTYYFWSRGVNAVGAGPWSARTSMTTLRVPDPPSAPVLSNIQPTSLDVSWTPNGNGGSPITGFQVGYGTNSSTPDTTISATSPQSITGLTPGVTYYFWVRAQNAIGYSPWSSVTSSQTIAGARINVGGVWKIAIPYVKSGGVWKHAIPYAKTAGVWKETV